MPQTIHPERGGTGQSELPAEGEILIGDGTKFTLASLQTLLEAFLPVSTTPPSNPAVNQLWVDAN